MALPKIMQEMSDQIAQLTARVDRLEKLLKAQGGQPDPNQAAKTGQKSGAKKAP